MKINIEIDIDVILLQMSGTEAPYTLYTESGLPFMTVMVKDQSTNRIRRSIIEELTPLYRKHMDDHD
jgi:hypothetical protein